MSKLIVDVTTISKVREHPNADKLEIAEIKGWQVCVGKDQFAEGDKVVYFPPDTVLPRFVTDAMNVTNYMPKVDRDRAYQFSGRVKQVRLRGEPSFGLVVTPYSDEWEIGEDVADCYGATKYEPPLRIDAGDSEPSHPLFVRYTDIENMRNYPGVFADGEDIVITEKIHGTNCRIGFVPENGEARRVAGSHNLQRKRPAIDYSGHLYWHIALHDGVDDLLNHLSKERKHNQVVLFGETYGKRVQKGFGYGEENELGFRAFDLYTDGVYLNHVDKAALFESFGIPMVPVLYKGPFDIEKVKELSSGTTTVADVAHIREGVVVTPAIERRDPKIGRVILKYVSDEYLLSKHSDFKDE